MLFFYSDVMMCAARYMTVDAAVAAGDYAIPVVQMVNGTVVQVRAWRRDAVRVTVDTVRVTGWVRVPWVRRAT